MKNYKHAKEKPNNRKLTIALGVLGAGVVGPLAMSGTANAASVDAWDKIAQCESNGLWNRPDGDFGKSSGGLQFQPASWKDSVDYLRAHGVDVSGYPYDPSGTTHQAYKATKEQQIMAGEALLALQGPNAWTCNAKMGYPLQSKSDSVFLGGPNPFPVSTPPTTPPPAPEPSQPSQPSEPAPKVPKKYMVKSGDTLYGITKAGTGDGSYYNWKPLYNANRAVVGGNPNRIYPGQILSLPWASETPVTETPKPPVTPSGSYVAPLDARITQSYGNPGAGYTLGFHTGTDFSAAHGTPVKAVSSGVVVPSDNSAPYGLNVQIRNADGTYSLYAHLSAKSVAPGQTVTAGQVIGNVGNSGTHSAGPHLHLEIRKSPTFAAGNFLNPVVWLASHGVTV